jgi:hypothetical protein
MVSTVVAFILATVIAFSLGAQMAPTNYWSGAYTPTRAEWLVLQLNLGTETRCDLKKDPECVPLGFGVLAHEQALVLTVVQNGPEGRTRTLIAEALESVRRLLRSERWGGNTLPVRVVQVAETITTFDCILKKSTVTDSPIRYGSIRLVDVCDSVTPVHTGPPSAPTTDRPF